MTLSLQNACYTLFVRWICARPATIRLQNTIIKRNCNNYCHRKRVDGGRISSNRFKKKRTGHSGVMAIVMAVRCNVMHKMQCYASAFMHMWKCMSQRRYTLFLCVCCNAFFHSLPFFDCFARSLASYLPHTHTHTHTWMHFYPPKKNKF